MTLVRCQRPFGSDSSGYYPLFVSSSVNGLLQINCGNSLLYYFAVLGPFFAWQTGSLCSYPQSFFCTKPQITFWFRYCRLKYLYIYSPASLGWGGGRGWPYKTCFTAHGFTSLYDRYWSNGGTTGTIIQCTYGNPPEIIGPVVFRRSRSLMVT